MFTLPILVFYACLHVIFTNKKDPTMWAGGCAVITANIIIGGYVYSAFSEEDDENDRRPSKGDASGPKSGAFKTRTD